jgi:proteic killer suppression protein
MIKSFRCRDTEALADDEPVKRFKAIERVARRKLEMLASAGKLPDLRSPPGNRLEALKGERKGQHSIRINAQWRICFRWDEAPRMWKSSTTTDAERAAESRTMTDSSTYSPGEILLEESCDLMTSARASLPATSMFRSPHKRHHPRPAALAPTTLGLLRVPHVGRVFAQSSVALRSEGGATDCRRENQERH